MTDAIKVLNYDPVDPDKMRLPKGVSCVTAITSVAVKLFSVIPKQTPIATGRHHASSL